MKKYYRSNGQIRKGPFSLKELKAQSFADDDYIWCEGLEDWQPADKLDGIAGLAPTNEGRKAAMPSVSIAVSSKTDRLRLWSIITLLYVFVVTKVQFLVPISRLFEYEFDVVKWTNPAFYIYHLAKFTEIAMFFLLARSINNPKWRKIAYGIALIEGLFILFYTFISDYAERVGGDYPWRF